MCRGVALHKVPAASGSTDGKENGGGPGGKNQDMAVASVQMSSVDGATFLAAAWNAMALAASEGGDKDDQTAAAAEATTTMHMRAYVALPVGVQDKDDAEEMATADIDAEVLEQMRKVERGLWRQYQEEANGNGKNGSTAADADAAAGVAAKDNKKEEEDQTNTEDTVKIDVSKVAAAAGGGGSTTRTATRSTPRRSWRR